MTWMARPPRSSVATEEVTRLVGSPGWQAELISVITMHPALLLVLSWTPLGAAAVLSEAAFACIGFGAGALFGRARWRPAPMPISSFASSIRARPGASRYGVGLICVQDVAPGERICGCEPRFSRTVPLTELDELPLQVRTTIHELWDGVDEPPGSCSVPLDYEQAIPIVSFINHSLEPNCEYDPEQHAVVASRPLRVGDEATVNYFEYQDGTSWTYRHADSGFSEEFAQQTLAG